MALVVARDLVAKQSTWPWRPETLRWFASALFAPIVVWGALLDAVVAATGGLSTTTIRSRSPAGARSAQRPSGPCCADVRAVRRRWSGVTAFDAGPGVRPSSKRRTPVATSSTAASNAAVLAADGVR